MRQRISLPGEVVLLERPVPPQLPDPPPCGGGELRGGGGGSRGGGRGELGGGGGEFVKGTGPEAPATRSQLRDIVEIWGEKV